MTAIPLGALVRDRELPELGPGRVVAELEGGASRIFFEQEDEIRDVDISRVDVGRLPLIPGVRVQARVGEFGNKEEKEAVIRETQIPDSADELCDYVVEIEGDETLLSEKDLFPLEPRSSSPVDQFEALHWRGPFRFFARWGMHRMISRFNEDSEGIPSLIGARIEPQPAQVHGARRVLWSERPGHVLADESGEDRMLEAGMVVQARDAEDPDHRTLIVCPGGRSVQWKTQLEMRFGGRDFQRITHEHFQSVPPDRWERFFDAPRVIFPAGALLRYANMSVDLDALIRDGDWDTVVVDEASRFDHDDDAFETLQSLAKDAGVAVCTSPAPGEPDFERLDALLGLVRPKAYGPGRERADFESRMSVWGAFHEASDGLGDEPSEDELGDVADALEEAVEPDEAFDSYLADLRDGDADALDYIRDHLCRFYGLCEPLVRTSRRAGREVGTAWPERSSETLAYEASEAERQVGELLEELPEAEDGPYSLQHALRLAYMRAAASTPGLFVAFLENRLQQIAEESLMFPEEVDVLDLFAMDPGPNDEQDMWRYVLEQADPLPDEKGWIARALEPGRRWRKESGLATARFEAVGDWIAENVEGPLEEEETPEKVVVFSRHQHVVQELSVYFEERFGDRFYELCNVQLPRTIRTDAAARFRKDPDCRVLLCDELGGAGHDITGGTNIIHVDLPFTPLRAERRIERLEAPVDEERGEIRSIVVQGPSEVEAAAVELYDDAMEVFDRAPGSREGRIMESARDVLEATSRGPDALSDFADDFGQELEADDSSAFQGAIETSPVQLEDAKGFTELLDFIDGIDNPLPVRHWARMLGITDHRAGPGVYDFKWHWSSVRRDIAGFDTPEGDDPEEWTDEETVEFMTGTFGRKRALNDESLEFFGPGHQLVDGLVKDAESPNDGRATVFARRLGTQHRGSTFLAVVTRCELDHDCFGELEMPRGLLRRAYQHLWPESASAMLELDLSGDRDPKLVEDTDLLNRLEEPYQGPQADQKVEYEMFVQAIGDAGRFRRILHDAVDKGIEALKDERDWLIEDATQRLEEDFEPEIAYYRSLAERSDDEDVASRAERQVELRERLIKAVENEKPTVDALAVIVGGQPEELLRR